MKWCNAKGDVTRDDLQQRFLAQHSITALLWHCFEWLQNRFNIATLYCAKKASLRFVPYNIIALSSEGNKNDEQTTIGLISKKRDVARPAHTVCQAKDSNVLISGNIFQKLVKASCIGSEKFVGLFEPIMETEKLILNK